MQHVETSRRLLNSYRIRTIKSLQIGLQTYIWTSRTPFGHVFEPGSLPGLPWGPDWKGNPKNHKKITFSDLLLGVGLKQFSVFSRSLNFQRFLNLSFIIFLVPETPRGSTFEPLWARNPTLLEYIWKNENCIIARERTPKSSF